MTIIYQPKTLAEERTIVRVHQNLRKRFDAIRLKPQQTKTDAARRTMLRLLNRTVCSRGPARLRFLVGTEKYELLLRKDLPKITFSRAEILATHQRLCRGD